MIYIDELQHSRRFRKAAKMISDNGPDELIEFGKQIGLYWPWMKWGVVPFFDVTEGKRVKAIQAGAVAVERKKFVELLGRLNNTVKKAG